MSINIITTEDLRGMDDREGLILQGCGGDLQEWVDGINELLTKEEIGLSLLWFCDEMWIFGDEVSEGMRGEILFCKNLNIRMKNISDKEIRKVIGGKNV